MSSIWTVRRSASDVKLTGLCGGVAEHWGVDPVLVRVGGSCSRSAAASAWCCTSPAGS